MTEHENELPNTPFQAEPGSPDSSDGTDSILTQNVDAVESGLNADIAAETALEWESLTLADVMGRLFKRPKDGVRLVRDIVTTPAAESGLTLISENPETTTPPFAPILPTKHLERKPRRAERDANPNGANTSAPIPGIVRGDGTITVTMTLPVPQVDLAVPVLPRPSADVRRLEIAQFVLRLIGYVAALWGGVILLQAGVQGNADNLPIVAPFWLFGMMLWFAAGALDWARPLRALRVNDDPRRLKIDSLPSQSVSEMGDVMPRLILGGITLVLTYIALIGTAGNLVTTIGFIAWVVSMFTAAWTFAPAGWSPPKMLRGIGVWVRGWRLHINWVTLALIGIMIVGGFFRFTALDTPPEMTSDHVEKIINAQEILDGTPRVFFFNNGGREPIQMYLMALLSQVPLPGLGVNFFTLKLLTAIEGLITLPVIFWLGRAVIGGGVDRRLGDLVGLAAAALVAVSFWHEVLSHLGLRIVLTSLVISLLLIFLIRGLRTNNRSQFILAGLTLGIGLYTYQAVRMAPLVVIIAFVIGVLYRVRDWRGIQKLIGNGIALVAIAFVCFVPMLGYIRESPDAFFQRTSTRILGDEVLTETDPEGNLIRRQATLLERVGAVLPQFQTNLTNAFLGYNFKGDSAWFQNAPFHPFMDAVTGGFLIVGLVGWLMLMLRKRDPGIDLWLPMIVIMILPSALAIAFPNENPSATRLSGTLPGVYILAAFGMVLLLERGARVIAGKRGFIGAAIAALVLIYAAYSINVRTFVVDYRTEYMNSHLVYSEPGQNLRAFVDGGGAWGNAFFIFRPYWWDHRGVVIEAGNIHFPVSNSISMWGENNRDHVPEVMRDAFRRTDEYRFDPNKPIFFLFAGDDEETWSRLQEWFPEGTAVRHETYQTNVDDPYWSYYVPPLGEGRFLEWLAENDAPLT